MIISLSNQSDIFFVTILIGFIIGLIYDFFRLIRKIFNHKNTFVYIEDAIFGLTSTFICFYILLHKNNLDFRFYLLIGISIGLILYMHLISFFVLTFALKFINFLIKPISMLLQFFIKLLNPFIKSFNLLKNKTSYKKKIHLQKLHRYVKIKNKDFITTIKIILNKI